jgi:hypothetical protein
MEIPCCVTSISYPSEVGLPAASTKALEFPRVMKREFGSADFPVTTDVFRLRVDCRSSENVLENAKSVGGIRVSPSLSTEF